MAETKELTILEKLNIIQTELKAPKGQTNSFGKYQYRSCEDILNALKPFLKEHKLIILLSDELKVIGSRYYIEATATLRSDTEFIEIKASAREEETKKGMDGSQVTGASSSYARKYALNGLFAIDDAKDSEYFARKVKDSNGVYVVPAFVGLGAPYWDMYARGAIFGLTQGVTDKHLVRATLESIAYQTKDLISAMEKDSGIALKYLSVDGGASQNDFLMQFQADLLNTPVIRPVITETTSLGAALLAGLAIGFWSENDLHNELKIERTFYPNMSDETRTNLHNSWTKAVKRTMNWES